MPQAVISWIKKIAGWMPQSSYIEYPQVYRYVDQLLRQSSPNFHSTVLREHREAITVRMVRGSGKKDDGLVFGVEVGRLCLHALQYSNLYIPNVPMSAVLVVSPS